MSTEWLPLYAIAFGAIGSLLLALASLEDHRPENERQIQRITTAGALSILLGFILGALFYLGEKFGYQVALQKYIIPSVIVFCFIFICLSIISYRRRKVRHIDTSSSPVKSSSISESSTPKVHRTVKFNPLAWGMLTFIFWLTIQSLEKQDCLQQIVAWFSFAISIALFLSIFIPQWGRLLEKPRAINIFIPVVFTFSILGYAVSWITKLPQMQGLIFHFSFWLGFLWLIAHIMVLVRSVNRIFGNVVSALLLIIGILYFTVGSNIIAGTALLVLSIFLFLLANRIINIWHDFRF